MSGPVAVLAGHGGSGTKRVFNILDMSPRTHCRWPPYLLTASPFHTLAGRTVTGEAEERELHARWDDIIEWTRVRIGRLDRTPPVRKRHVRAAAHWLRLWKAMRCKPVRRALSLAQRDLARDEWRAPPWLCHSGRLRQATLAVKLNKAPGWIAWVARSRPQTRIAHVVRHPGGYLNAWRGRWVEGSDAEATAEANRDRLRAIALARPQWAARFGDIESMGCLEAELWFWRCATETIHETGSQLPGYTLIRDEDVLDDAVGAARRLVERVCGHPAGADLEAAVRRRSEHWSSRRKPWRQLHDSATIGCVERVLDGSPMGDWWDDDQSVSLYDYRAF